MQAIIDRIKAIPKALQRATPACASSVAQEIAKQAAAGRSPNGKAWQPTKAGKAPLPNAAGSAAKVGAVGTTIVTQTTFPYGFHQLGARGGTLPVREVLPSELTPNLQEAIRKPLVEAFNKAKGGG